MDKKKKGKDGEKKIDEKLGAKNGKDKKAVVEPKVDTKLKKRQEEEVIETIMISKWDSFLVEMSCDSCVVDM